MINEKKEILTIQKIFELYGYKNDENINLIK